VVTVVRGRIEEFVTSQGKLEPRTYVDIGTQVTGQLQKIYVDYGATVKQGDLLAEIDPRLYQARVDAGVASIKNLQAQIREQEANLLLAQQRLGREKELLQYKATSVQLVQEATAVVAATDAKIRSLRAQIEQIESTLSGDRANLSFTKIHAPMDGVVVDLLAREGQTLNANQTTPTILQLADLDTMTVRVQVAEADVFRLRPTMEVYFSPLGLLEKRWISRIRQTLPTPQLINEVVLYNVLVDADNKDRQLLNGMTAQVFFTVGKNENALLLPVEAVGPRDPSNDVETGKAYTVTLWDNGETIKKSIFVGLNDRRNVEVISGLTEGDQVLVERADPERSRAASGGMMRNRGPKL
jgi:macrolide-specific efflux system membrane fusion protein